MRTISPCSQLKPDSKNLSELADHLFHTHTPLSTHPDSVAALIVRWFGMIEVPGANPKFGKAPEQQALRRFTATLQRGQTEYQIVHSLGSEDVIVQTRIAGRIREGGISIVDANTVRIEFGGPLNEPMQVVVVG